MPNASTIQSILDGKGTEVYWLSPDASVYQAIEMMATKGVGALLVLEEGKLVGIVSERDYARKVILQGRASKETAVADIMTADVISVSLHDSVDHCLGVMTDHKIRHLPVLDEGRLVGVLSIGDLVKAIIDDQRHQIQSLEQYIAG